MSTRRCQQSEVDLTFPEPMRARSFSACLKTAEFKNSTIIRLLDGSKAYLHAIIDNFSRRVHAWRVNDSFIPAVTADLLIEAFDGSTRGKPQLLVDDGVENYNSAVDKLVDSGVLQRILAQTESRYSNSLIESWWRVIKHQWLFLNTLDTAAPPAAGAGPARGHTPPRQPLYWCGLDTPTEGAEHETSAGSAAGVLRRVDTR